MNNNSSTAIGKRLAEIRRSNHITQEKLAEMLGVSPKHISHIECGTSSLSLKNLMQFCQIFHCSLDYIMFGRNINDSLSRLPNQISQILYTGSDADIDRLNRYLQIYVELLERKH